MMKKENLVFEKWLIKNWCFKTHYFLLNSRLANVSLLAYLLIIIPIAGFAQGNNKVSFFGGARAYFTQNGIAGNSITSDTTHAKQANSGHTLIDLGINVKPNKEHHICAILRARNEFGGFYGQGASVKIRQLYAAGSIAKIIGYRIGDLDLNQSRFSLWNYSEENSQNESTVFSRLREVQYYENFYSKKNTWRMQGAELNASLLNGNENTNFSASGFITRNRSASNFILPEVFLSGASLSLKQKEKWSTYLHWISTYTIPNTSSSENNFQNPVITGKLSYILINRSNRQITMQSELGYSELKFSEMDTSQNGSFFEVDITSRSKISGVYYKVQYRAVSPQFFSSGAQTKRIVYSAAPTFFPMYGNNSRNREANFWDYLYDPSLYNRGISTALMRYNPMYASTFAYGDATPNRQGIFTEIGMNRDSAALNWKIEASRMNEILGQGIQTVTQFSYLNSSAELNLARLFGNKRRRRFKCGMQWEHANRNADTVRYIDFSAIQMDAGLDWEILDRLEILAGVKLLQAKGRTFVAEYNQYNAVENFNRLDFDQRNWMWAYGVSYKFSSTMHLSLMANQSKVDNSLSDDKYTLNRFYVLYNLMF